MKPLGDHSFLRQMEDHNQGLQLISAHDIVWPVRSGELSRFRQELYQCLTARADTLFELAEAVVCAQGQVTSLAELSLTAENRRGHGALYDSVNCGRIDITRFGRVVAGRGLPRCADGRTVLAIDVSNWLRQDANASPDRLFCHTYGRGRGQAQMIPGWPYSFVAALEPGSTSVAARQLREVVERLITAGHCGTATRRSGSSAIPAMTDPAWRSSWPIYPSGCGYGCARTVCCVCPRRPRHWERAGARLATAASSASPTPRPGPPPSPHHHHRHQPLRHRGGPLLGRLHPH
jgi:DDE superfamily endonuclease